MTVSMEALREVFVQGRSSSQKALEILNKTKKFCWKDYEKIAKLPGTHIVKFVTKEEADLYKNDLPTLQCKIRENATLYVVEFSLMFLLANTGKPHSDADRKTISDLIKADPEFLESFIQIKDLKQMITPLLKFLDSKGYPIREL